MSKDKTNAERQKRHRERMKARGAFRVTIALDGRHRPMMQRLASRYDGCWGSVLADALLSGLAFRLNQESGVSVAKADDGTYTITGL